MWFKSFGLRTLIIGVALVIGLTVGVLGSIGYAIANNYSNENPATAHVFSKNESGQTYGSGSDATSLDTMPDLISAYGVDDTSGYVRKVDLFGELPKNPEEAVAYQRKRDHDREAGIVFYQIPLYAVDGKTVIGVFNISNEEAGATSSKVSPSTK